MEIIIDEAATIGNILNVLRQVDVKTSDVAKAIDGISEETLRRALNLAGYEFQNITPKGWYYIGSGEEPTEESIFDYVQHLPYRAKIGSRTVPTEFTRNKIEVNATVPGAVIHSQFTQNETQMLLEMLHEWQQKKQAEQNGGLEEISLYERIKSLPGNAKIRKTIVIDELIGKRLDDFCAKEKVNKSDVMYLALMDFLNKYE